MDGRRFGFLALQTQMFHFSIQHGNIVLAVKTTAIHETNRSKSCCSSIKLLSILQDFVKSALILPLSLYGVGYSITT